MILREQGGRTLMDAAMLFVHLGQRIAIQTIRVRCVSVGKDAATGRQLYDVDAAEAALAGVRPRATHKRSGVKS